MSADFWAGYISGAVGIVIGNPLDILKVRLQARGSHTSAPAPVPASASASPPTPAVSTGVIAPRRSPAPASASASVFGRHFLTGTAAPVLGYGALNALLFVSYNRSEALLSQALPTTPTPTPASAPATASTSLWATWLAGAIGGLATWVVSTPTELVKCRAQLGPHPDNKNTTTTTSWHVARQIWRAEGLRGFYLGGVVTALRDSIGYGFYFWSYELSTRWMTAATGTLVAAGGGGAGAGVGAGGAGPHQGLPAEAARVLLCGGLAGIVTWVSVFPLDVVKTRVQTQLLAQPSRRRPASSAEQASLLPPAPGDSASSSGAPRPAGERRMGAVGVARQAYAEGGAGVFFRGLGVCSVRAFVVNAVQWAAYEWIMLELGQGRRRAAGGGLGDGVDG